MKHRKEETTWTVMKGIFIFYLVVAVGILLVEQQLNTLTLEAPALRAEAWHFTGTAFDTAQDLYAESMVYADRVMDEIRLRSEAF